MSLRHELARKFKKRNETKIKPKAPKYKFSPETSKTEHATLNFCNLFKKNPAGNPEMLDGFLRMREKDQDKASSGFGRDAKELKTLVSTF